MPNCMGQIAAMLADMECRGHKHTFMPSSPESMSEIPAAVAAFNPSVSEALSDEDSQKSLMG